jgi:hypothetical protein
VQDVEAGHLRHHQIEDQDIRLFPLDCLEGLLTVESNRRAEFLPRAYVRRRSGPPRGRRPPAPDMIDDLIAGAPILHRVTCGAQVSPHDSSLLVIVFHEQNSQVG